MGELEEEVNTNEKLREQLARWEALAPELSSVYVDDLLPLPAGVRRVDGQEEHSCAYTRL